MVQSSVITSLPTLSGLMTLHSGEQKLIEENERIIQSGTGEEQTALIQRIKLNDQNNYSLEKIVRYAEKSTVFNDFCETNLLLNAKWKEWCLRLNCPSFEIKALHSPEKNISIFARIKSAFLLSQYKKYEKEEKKAHPKAIEILEKACEFKLYHALNLKLKFCSVILNDAIKEGRTVNDNLMQDMNDTTTDMIEFYYSCGYLDAAHVLFDMAYYYLHVDNMVEKLLIERFEMASANVSQWDWPKQYDAKQGTLPSYVITLQTAAEYMYIAAMIEEKGISKTLVDKFYPKQGLLENYKDENGKLKFSNWQAVYKDHVEKIEKRFPKFPLPEKFCTIAQHRAIEKVAEILEKMGHSESDRATLVPPVKK